jgi:hypothetical protein
MGFISEINSFVFALLFVCKVSIAQCTDENIYGSYIFEGFIDENGDTLNRSDSNGYYQGVHVFFEYEKITNTKWGAYTKGKYINGKPVGDWKEHHLNGSYSIGKFKSGISCRTINGKFDCKEQGIYKKIGWWKCYNVFGKLVGEVYFDSTNSIDQLKSIRDKQYRSLYQTTINDTLVIISANKIEYFKQNELTTLKPLSLNDVKEKYGTSYAMSYWSVVSRWSDRGPISHIEKEVTYKNSGYTFRFHNDDTLKYYLIRSPAKCKVFPNVILGKTTLEELFKTLGNSSPDENYDNSRRYTYFQYGDIFFGIKAYSLFGYVPFHKRLRKKIIRQIKIIY